MPNFEHSCTRDVDWQRKWTPETRQTRFEEGLSDEASGPRQKREPETPKLLGFGLLVGNLWE